MAKFARPDEKPFSPLTLKLIDEASGTNRPLEESIEQPYKHEGGNKEKSVVPLFAGVEERQQRNFQRGEELEIETSEDQLTESMRYRVSRVERREIEKFVQRLSDAACVSLTHSNIMRAYRDILFQVEEKLVAELEKTKLKRPMNDRRALTIFEARLAEIIHSAIRQTPLAYTQRSRG